MSKIIKYDNKVEIVKNMRDALGRVDPSPDSLYLFLGRSVEWTDEFNPDVAVDTIAMEETLRNNIFAIKRVLQTNTAFVIPRVNWTTSTIYAQYDSTDAALIGKNFYVLTDDNNVYKCLNNNSGVASINKPTGTSVSPISTGDGYQWKFMYNLSSTMITDFLTTNWLPVPYGSQKTTFQISVENAAAWSTGTPAGGHGKSAIHELGAHYLMVSRKFENTESGVIDATGTFRQIGAWINPTLISSGAVATATVSSVNDTNSDINPLTGRIIYFENKTSSSRATNQNEKLQFVFNIESV